MHLSVTKACFCYRCISLKKHQGHGFLLSEQSSMPGKGATDVLHDVLYLIEWKQFPVSGPLLTHVMSYYVWNGGARSMFQM
jgi:hypothetical protein